jgi:hypothetical protein
LTSKREKSRGETVRKDGTKAVRHNWRCVEVIPSKAPAVDSEPQEDEPMAETPAPKKRGRKPSVKKTETTPKED